MIQKSNPSGTRGGTKYENPVVHVTRNKGTHVAVYFSREAMNIINSSEIEVRIDNGLMVRLPIGESKNIQKITKNNQVSFQRIEVDEEIFGFYIITGEDKDGFILEKIED